MTYLQILLASFLMFLFLPDMASAQQAARTGATDVHPAVRADLPEAGELLFEYTRQQGDSSATFGTIYERISRDRAGGTLLIVFEQVLAAATMRDSLVADLETYHPRSYRSHAADIQDIQVHYNFTPPGGTHVSMWREFPGQSVDTSMTISTASPAYDYHWPHTLLYALEALDEKDDVINLPVFTYLRGSGQQPISYGGEEEVNLHGTSYRTLVWTATDPQSGTENTWWIDKDTRRLVRSKAELPNGLVFWISRKAG